MIMQIYVLSSAATAYDLLMMHDRSNRRAKENVAPIVDKPAANWAWFIRQRRIHLRLRQDELAALAGVSTRSVHAIESGKATARLDVLLAVTNTLGLKLSIASSSATIEVTDTQTSAAEGPKPAPGSLRTRKPGKAAIRG
jgi:HTH-type transcriptional regulator / antitoxin HipB